MKNMKSMTKSMSAQNPVSVSTKANLNGVTSATRTINLYTLLSHYLHCHKQFPVLPELIIWKQYEIIDWICVS